MISKSVMMITTVKNLRSCFFSLIFLLRLRLDVMRFWF